VSASYNRVTCASGKAKETYSGGKRDLLRRQKRPTLEAKETYSGGKRDLLWRQKRPTQEAKETYSGGKRDVQLHKRGTRVRQFNVCENTWVSQERGGERGGRMVCTN
jgi:hypothetical protein